MILREITLRNTRLADCFIAGDIAATREQARIVSRNHKFDLFNPSRQLSMDCAIAGETAGAFSGFVFANYDYWS